MRKASFILAVIILATGGVSVQPVHAGADPGSCCCVIQQAAVEADACCESDAKPAESRAEACPCHLQSPDTSAVSEKFAIVPIRSDSHDLVAVLPFSSSTVEWNRDTHLPRHDSDAGPPGPSRPIRLLICSLLN
jgi:hypothetical protein